MGKESTVNWAKADWRKQDVILAAELGCSREWVRRARNDPRFGNGARPDRFRKRTVVTAEERLEAMNTAGMMLNKAARLAGCAPKHAGRVLRRLGKGFVRKPKGNFRHDWTKFPANWTELTDKEIAGIVGVGDPAVVTQWRNRHGYRRPAKPGKQRPAMANPYATSSGYYRIFQRLVAAPPVTEAELADFARRELGKSLSAAESSVWVVVSPREGGRNPRGNRSSRGHLYYVSEDADGKLHAHPRVPPMEPARRERRRSGDGPASREAAP